MNINKYLKSGIILGALVYSVGTTIPAQPTYADEINTETVIKEWKPEGNIIAQGEDGVPWELYENGYLLFKPEPGKDTLTSRENSNSESTNLTWRNHSTIKAIGSTNKLYLPKDSSYLFAGGPNQASHTLKDVEYIEAEKFDTSNVKNMSGMFHSLTNLTKLDISKWDTSKVEDMSGMFYYSAPVAYYKEPEDFSNIDEYTISLPDKDSELKLDVSKWDTSKVKSMEGMFEFSKISQIDLSKWNTESLENTHNMFFRSELYNIGDLSKWDTSKLTNISGMFQESNIVELNINNWDVSNVKNMAGSFSLMPNITKLDLSKWNTSNVKDMTGLFNGNKNLKYLDITNWNTANVEKIFDDNMFAGDLSLTHLKLGDKFANTKLNTELFNFLNMHRYGNRYGEKWAKEDNTTKYYTVEEWNKEYRANPNKLSGMWTRERSFDYYTLKFETGTAENIDSLEVEIGKDFDLPTPTKVKEGYHFVGWSKTQDGEVIKDKNNLGKNKEIVTLYAKWEKNPTVSSVTPIDDNGYEVLPPVINELPEYNGGANPADAPVHEVPEYTGPLSTNTPVDDNGDLILPPIVNELPEFNGGVNPTDAPVNEVPEYTGSLSTNTPIDDNGELVLPPVVNELPEFNGGVNPTDAPVNEVPEYTGSLSTNTPIDDNGELVLPPVVNELPEYIEPSNNTEINTIEKVETSKDEIKKNKVLPDTNSSSVIAGLVSSVIGTLGLGYKSKKRK